MNRFRNVITIACVAILFLVHAGEPLAANGHSVDSPFAAADLQSLQGRWEGFLVGQEKDGKITLTITGNSLYFHRDTNFWFDTKIALPAGTNPKQLHATIKSCPPKDSIGQVVVAIFKVEGETLTLATGNGDGEAPKSFEATGVSRYKLRKVPSPKGDVEPTKIN